MRKQNAMTKIRAAAGMVCAVLVLSSSAPAFVRAEDNNALEITSEEGAKVLTQIRLSIGSDQETPVFRAGENVQLQINVSNTGNADAQNVRIAPVIEKESEWPFELDKLNLEQDLGTIEAGKTVTAVWGSEEKKLKVRDDVSGGAYRLAFHITYNDGENACETDKYVFVKSIAQEKNTTENISQGNPAAEKNQEVQLPAAGSDNLIRTGTVPQESGGVYNGEPVVTGGTAATETASVPRVIVTGFETQPGEVRAGSNFKLIIHLKNTSGKTQVSNMLFDLQAPSSGSENASEAPAFLPASGSSSVYLDNIPAGGQKDISIELNARADLIQKPYSIAMTMKYEDSKATQYEAQSSLAIPVVQKARFEFSKIQIAPDPVTAGEEVNISCSLYNLGRVKMYNVKAKIEGKAIEPQEQFVGNLDSGATGSIDMIVKAKEKVKGDSECKLILSYEDDAGNPSVSEQKFAIHVAEEEVMADVSNVETAEQEKDGIPVIVLFAVMILAAGGVAAVITGILKKRNKTQLSEEEEELFDEVERFTEDEHQQP